MADQPLFRAAALNAQKPKWLGNIILVRPLSYTILTWVAAACALLVVIFLIWGSYTKRSTVIGQLLPDIGVVKVYTPQLAVVAQKLVVEGQEVKKGDPLYVLSSERQSGAQGAIQAAISQQVQSRRQSLIEELEKTRRLQREERDALAKRIDGLSAEGSNLANQIEVQSARVALGDETAVRYRNLLAKDYIARDQLQQKEAELLDQKARLQALERERISVLRELAARRNELSGLDIKHQTQLSQIERGISSTDQELTESEAKRQVTVVAPEGGIATALFAEVGQAVDGNRPLVSIMPKGATLQAQLYAPSRAIGFVRPGDAVLLRYQAYPYQKFGHARGKVISVAKTALPGSEISWLGNSASGNPQNNEPLYRVVAELESQTIMAYGQPQPLQAGMLVEADLLQETRRLIEWVLEPLYSLTGKL